ncbi:MAG TPA: FecR domain-containing protein [Steroidobacteraceae bacterium]|nr:FecR domain-containing protein [Steroidobacteraceae bacterium]
MRSRKHPDEFEDNEARIGLEAAEFLLLLTDGEPDAEGRYPDSEALYRAFLGWLKRCPAHMRIFLETCETNRRLGHVDSRSLIDVKRLIEGQRDDVIALHPSRRGALRANNRTRFEMLLSRAIRVAWPAVPAAMVMLFLFISVFGTQSLTTGIGEQLTCKLEDGSFVVLNTDSRIELDFTRSARNIRLVRGEALFMVEHDARRPFVVRADDARVSAIGTQFNVRQRAGATEVSVVEGTVEVTPLDKQSAVARASQPPANSHPSEERAVAPDPVSVTAGEKAQVSLGRVSKSVEPAVDVLAWRQRRLIFYDATLAEVADEFNRYNRSQIRVEGAAALQRLTGIFDADHPQSLILYASREDSLVVLPAGGDWVISAR